MAQPATYYALRYFPEVLLDLRRHAPTPGRWEDFADAEDERRKRPGADLMEVVVRSDPERQTAA